MDLGVSVRLRPILDEVKRFIGNEILPLEHEFFAEVDKGDRWLFTPRQTEIMETLKSKARERGHILEGLAVALSNVDEIIALIKAAATPADAKRGLTERSWRSPVVEEMLLRAAADAPRPEGLSLIHI